MSFFGTTSSNTYRYQRIPTLGSWNSCACHQQRRNMQTKSNMFKTMCMSPDIARRTARIRDLAATSSPHVIYHLSHVHTAWHHMHACHTQNKHDDETEPIYWLQGGGQAGLTPINLWHIYIYIYTPHIYNARDLFATHTTYSRTIIWLLLCVPLGWHHINRTLIHL